MADKNNIHLSSSPHFSEGLSTTKVMLLVILALLPEAVFGVVIFGIRALVTILASVLSCVAFEWLFQKIIGKKRTSVKDLSAVVTGLILALVCPPAVPVWMVVLGAFFAIVVAKGLFGGIGANVFNPALTGRAFMFISFPKAMGAGWLLPNAAGRWSFAKPGIDAISGATALPLMKSGSFDSAANLKDLFFGFRPGCIGETSILIILICWAILVLIRIVDWRATVSYLGVLTICLLCAGKTGADLAAQLMAGGVVLGAAFMATDYATAPVTGPGRLVFGAGCGLITFLIRQFGSYPEGCMFSILIMNAIAPFLNNLTTRKYGYGKKASAKKQIAKPVENKQEESK